MGWGSDFELLKLTLILQSIALQMGGGGIKALLLHKIKKQDLE